MFILDDLFLIYYTQPNHLLYYKVYSYVDQRKRFSYFFTFMVLRAAYFPNLFTMLVTMQEI